MLELINVSAGYGSEPIIKNISLTFEPGNIYAIIGKNGCGKSTLLKTCAHMIRPTAGKILLNGKNITEYQSLERAREIAYLSQHRNTPNISVERLLVHGRHPHMSHLKKMRGEDWAKLEEVMVLLDITEFRNKNLSELSGGERQRVYIAMLFVQDTPILLLDEPTTYMDISYQLDFLKLLAQQKSAGKTILLVLHDLNQALQIADKMILMDQGKVFMKNSPDNIIAERGLEDIFQISVDSYIQDGRRFYNLQPKDSFKQ